MQLQALKTQNVSELIFISVWMEIVRPRVVWVFKRIYEASRDVLKDLFVYISFVTLRNSEIRMMSWRRL